MGQCDFHPTLSLHRSQLIDGKRMTHNGKVRIHKDIESKVVPDDCFVGSKKCESHCKNTFVASAEFYSETECIRCYEKRTKVNRS